MRKVLPSFSPAPSQMVDHRSKTWSGGMEPSSATHFTEYSTCSYQPPGLRWLMERSEMVREVRVAGVGGMLD